MANSRHEYVRSFEQPDRLIPNTWIVVRIDGRGFTNMCAKYNFEKPNDRRALDLMNAAAHDVVANVSDIVIAYGQSDEYSFVFAKSTELFGRRARRVNSYKLISTVVSTFSANYVALWSQHFPDTPLTAPFPTFDGRAVCYPTNKNLRDYMSWRQADCHINNLYNTAFWAQIKQGGLSNQQAEEALRGTVASTKNELLFSRFGVNYNHEPEIFRKGTVIFRMHEQDSVNPKRRRVRIRLSHDDIIGNQFWEIRPWIIPADE